VKGHPSRLEQMEDRISELEVKTEIKEKNRRNLSQILKSCEKNMQLNDSIKRPNSRIMSTEEGEEVQTKVIYNIFNKITKENFPNLEKVLPI
jgi:hypothetical protein